MTLVHLIAVCAHCKLGLAVCQLDSTMSLTTTRLLTATHLLIAHSCCILWDLLLHASQFLLVACWRKRFYILGSQQGCLDVLRQVVNSHTLLWDLL